MSRKMPLVLAGIIFALISCESFIPTPVKEGLYSLSLSIKAVIIFVLPLVVFGLLFKSAVNFAQGATRIMFFLLVGVCCSNFCSTILSHFIGAWVYGFDVALTLPGEEDRLHTLWVFDLPPLVSNDKAMFMGILSGILLTKCSPKAAQQTLSFLEPLIRVTFKILTWAVPAFVAGFVIRLHYEGTIAKIIKGYPLIFIIVAFAQFSYIGLIYLGGCKGRIREFLDNLKNMLPAAISGFSTMSSAASLPLTISGIEKNCKNPLTAHSVAPLTVNIHLIGDCVAIPIFAYAVLKNYGMPEPTFLTYTVFAFYFVLAKFSVAAVPGGGVLVMLPILQAYLGFNDDMMSLITALYILFDPVITCANVMGNGAFSKIFDQVGFLLKPPLLKR